VILTVLIALAFAAPKESLPSRVRAAKGLLKLRSIVSPTAKFGSQALSCSFSSTTVRAQHVYNYDGSCPAPPFASDCIYRKLGNFSLPCSDCTGTIDPYYYVSFTESQMIVNFTATSQWTDVEFNGLWIHKLEGKSFADAKLDNSSTFSPVSFKADEDNIYVDFTGLSYSSSQSFIVNLCGNQEGSCSSHTTCGQCASNGCEWCLDTKTCSEEPGSCHNYVGNPSYCPLPQCASFYSCDSCTSTDGECAWCLDSSTCQQADDHTCRDHIQDKTYCPSK